MWTASILFLAAFPLAGATSLECSGKGLAYDETPCLSGVLDEVLVAQDCNAGKIIAALQTAYTNAQRTGRWGHHRDLGYVAPKSYHLKQPVQSSTTCDWDFTYELKLITKTLSYDKAKEAIEKMCDAAEQEAMQEAKTTQWSDIDRRLTPDFMNEFTDGGTDLNNKIGNFQNPNKDEDTRLNRYYPTDDFSYSMGISIDSYYRNGARTSALAPVEHLDKCEHQTVMCCFGGDRQYDDNNGNCAKTNCDDAKPGDNTDICFAEGRRYRGAETAHCHGFAWSDVANDPSNKMRFNNFFYVLMHDHMYNRGYVRSVKYGAPMCACLEDMPIVSRADCSEIDLQATYKVSVTDAGEIVIKVHLLYFKFNACQGYYPGTKVARNNDLLGRVEKLYQEDKLNVSSRKAIDKHLVQNCGTAGYRD